MSKQKLKVALLNLMPTKKATEGHIKAILTDAGADFDLTLLTTASYQPKNTDLAYLRSHYTTLSAVKGARFDIFIITGASVEHLAFEEVAYWQELKEFLAFTRTNSLFNIFICWAAQAALYNFYGINKKELPQKYFGIFEQKIKNKKTVFYKGFSGHFLMPHSRHTTLDSQSVAAANLNIEAVCNGGAVSEISVLSSKDLKDLFITGHPEYSADTLHLEYRRDLQAAKTIDKPFNYYPKDNTQNPPQNTWRTAAVKFYKNIIEHVNNLKEKQETQYENI